MFFLISGYPGTMNDHHFHSGRRRQGVEPREVVQNYGIVLTACFCEDGSHRFSWKFNVGTRDLGHRGMCPDEDAVQGLQTISFGGYFIGGYPVGQDMEWIFVLQGGILTEELRGWRFREDLRRRKRSPPRRSSSLVRSAGFPMREDGRKALRAWAKQRHARQVRDLLCGPSPKGKHQSVASMNI